MEVDIEALQELVALLPPEWQRHIATLVLLWPAFALLLGPAKALVARCVTSPQARAWADAFFKVADLIALNTKGMDLRPLAEPKPKQGKKR